MNNIFYRLINLFFRNPAIAAIFASLSLSTLALSQTPVPSPPPLQSSHFNPPPTNRLGWSILHPSPDSRLLYVDSLNGNDQTAKIYTPASQEIGKNPHSPKTSIHPFKTISHAAKFIRPGYPDWLLLKKGRIWNEPLTLNGARGRSPSERVLATTYAEGNPPEIHTLPNQPAWLDPTPAFVAIIGIHFRSIQRDELSPFWNQDVLLQKAEPGLKILTLPPERNLPVQDILIEDCIFQTYASNEITAGYQQGGPIHRLIIRRCKFLRQWNSPHHGQGLWFAGHSDNSTPSLLVEDCIFDHNGWRIPNQNGNPRDTTQGQAQMLSHNLYMTGAKKVLIQNNYFLRPSSIGIKITSNPNSHRGTSEEVIIQNNVFVEGEVGISAGGNYDGPFRHRNFFILNNALFAIGRKPPTNRKIAFGIEIRDWDGGLVANNILSDFPKNPSDAWALHITQSKNGGSRNTVICNNTILGFYPPQNRKAAIRLELPFANDINNRLEKNYLSLAQPALVISWDGNAQNQWTLSSNFYVSLEAPTFQWQGEKVGFNAWCNLAKDKNSQHLSTRDFYQTFESYFEKFGFADAKLESILALLLTNQGNGQWNPKLEPKSLIEWFHQQTQKITQSKIQNSLQSTP